MCTAEEIPNAGPRRSFPGGERRAGSHFLARPLVTLAPPTGWVIGAGAFHDVSRSDLLAYRPENGTLWVGRNDGGAFTFTAPWG